MNVNVSEKALREIYLKPFEIAIKEGKPWAVMTSYNLINGTHCDANDWLLQKVLREQWGFDGLTMSDWGGVNTVVESLKAGLSLEMPGPARVRKTEIVKAAVKRGDLLESTLDERVTEVLNLLVRTNSFSDPEIPPEQAIDNPEHRKLIREIGAEGMVLLKNNDEILPLKQMEGKKIALLGQSKESLAHGGGSASVNAHYKISPWEAFQREAQNGTEFLYAKGAHIYRTFDPLQTDISDHEGQKGCTVTRFNRGKEGLVKLSVANAPDTHFSAIEELCDILHLDTTYRPHVTGRHYLEFISTGPAKLFINDEQLMTVQDDVADQMAFILGGANGEKRQYSFEEGKEYRIHIETQAPEVRPGYFALLEGVIGITLGFMHQADFEEDVLSSAIEAAKTADTAVVFVGNSPAWETEGCDQYSMNLPAYGSQDKLIRAVADANPNTIVVISTGTPVAMPWLSKVKAVVQSWLPGQEAGNSIADVLLGRVCPSGRLPVTIPVSAEASPAHGNFPGDVKTLQVHYKEDVFVGHRYFNHHPESVLFPFGYGLSYTTFSKSGFGFRAGEHSEGTSRSFSASLDVTNTGPVAGSEVIQVYITPRGADGLPVRKLVGFSKATLAPGETKTCSVEWTASAFAEWDTEKSKWCVVKGQYELDVGTSSAAEDIVERVVFELRDEIWIEP